MMSQTMTLTQDDDASVVLMERRLSRKISGGFLAPVLGRTDVFVSFRGSFLVTKRYKSTSMMWSKASTHPAQAHVIAALLQVQTLQQLLDGLQKHTDICFFTYKSNRRRARLKAEIVRVKGLACVPKIFLEACC